MRNYSIKNTKWLNPGHELDYIASIINRKENRFYIVGTESEIRSFWRKSGKNIRSNIAGYILTENNDAVDCIGTISVVKDTDIIRDIYSIIVCVSQNRSNYEANMNLFSNYGFEENRQFFQGEVFSQVYDVYVNDFLAIDRVEIFVTSKCSLKCEKCISYIPYFKKTEHEPLEMLKDDVDLLFSKVDYVRKFKILGGEAFLYPDIKEYVDYVCERYGDRIESIRIGTNGTINPNKEIIDMLKRNHVVVDISDYMVTLGKRSKLQDVITVCKDNGVEVDIKRTGEQWLDMGFPNNIPLSRNEEQLQKHFNRCAFYCRDFWNGKFWFCCSNFAAVRAGLFEENRNDYLDFREKLSKKEILEFEVGYSSLGHTTFCKTCRGCSDEVNPFHVEVAKQVDKI